MKVAIHDNNYNVSIQLTPETLAEVGLLLRLSTNYKKESPDIYMSFSEHNTDRIPYCNISVGKVSILNQIASLSNKKK